MNMSKKISIGLTVAAMFAASPAAAGSVAIEANGARVDETWGAELGIGYGLEISGFTLRPMAGVLLYHGDNNRYVEDTFNNGQTRCRDLSNGQFADDALCSNVAAKAYGKLEATYTVSDSFEFGGGGRFDGGKIRPYGMASVPISRSFRLQGNVGDDFYAIGLRGSF